MFNNVINFPKIHVDFVDEVIFCIHKLLVDVSKENFNFANYFNSWNINNILMKCPLTTTNTNLIFYTHLIHFVFPSRFHSKLF
jgi:hypothetical protein